MERGQSDDGVEKKCKRCCVEGFSRFVEVRERID